MRFLKIIVLTFSLFFCIPVFSQSLKKLDEKENFDKIFELLDRAELELKSASRLRQLDCLKAVGDEILCSCIDTKLAIAWSFTDYVAITTRSKEDNSFDRLSPDLQAAYNNVAVVRDECVSSSAENKSK